MLISSVVAFFNATVFQGFSRGSCFTAAISGFSLDMVTKAGFDAAALIPDIPRLLERGGMLSMLNTVLIAFCAYGICRNPGCLQVPLDIVLNKLMKSVKSIGRPDCIHNRFLYYRSFRNKQRTALHPDSRRNVLQDLYQKGLQPKNLPGHWKTPQPVFGTHRSPGRQQAFIWQQHWALAYAFLFALGDPVLHGVIFGNHLGLHRLWYCQD